MFQFPGNPIRGKKMLTVHRILSRRFKDGFLMITANLSDSMQGI